MKHRTTNVPTCPECGDELCIYGPHGRECVCGSVEGRQQQRDARRPATSQPIARLVTAVQQANDPPGNVGGAVTRDPVQPSGGSSMASIESAICPVNGNPDKPETEGGSDDI